MKKIARLLALVLALACLLSLAACTQSAETPSTDVTPTQETANTSDTTESKPEETATTEENEPVTISMMMFQSWKTDVIDEILADIEATENIKVDLQVVPDDQMGQLVQTKAAVGELPDIVTQNSSQIAVLGAENFADLSNEEWVSRLSRPESVTYDGKIMGLPMNAYGGAGGVFYNKAVFEKLGIEVPTTWDEFMAICEKIKNEGDGIIPIIRSDKEDWTTQAFPGSYLPTLLYPNQEDVLGKTATNELSMTDIPEFKETVEKFLYIYDHGYVNEDYFTTDWATAQEYLANGTGAMIIGGDFLLATVRNNWPDKLDDIGFFPFPAEDHEAMICTGKDVWTLLVSANSEHLDAVKRFLNAYSQKAEQDKYYTANPSAQPAFTDSVTGDVPQLQLDIANDYSAKGLYYYEYLSYVPAEVSSVWYSSFTKNLMVGVTGGMTADEIISEYQNALAELMTANGAEGWN